MANNVTVNNAPLGTYDVRADEVDGKLVQVMRMDSLTVRIDEGATHTYFGYALPGTAESGATWRISRLTNSSGTLVYADGNSNFDNVWSDRSSLTYS